MQAQGFHGEEELLTRVEDMASLYTQAIQKFQPQGPYQIGGWSFGGVVAYEMAQQLHKQGHEVSLLAILDSYVPILLVEIMSGGILDAGEWGMGNGEWLQFKCTSVYLLFLPPAPSLY